MTQPLPRRRLPDGGGTTVPRRPPPPGGGRTPPGRRPSPDGTRPAPPAPPVDPGLGEEDQNAYNVLLAMLRNWGLESLAPEVLRLLQDGYSQEQVPILLQDTQAYKERFAGNEIRRKAGLPVLSPAEYLSVESSYRQIMSTAGLPPGYYDSHEDFSTWIGADVSPAEVNGRVQAAADTVYRMDDGTKRTLFEWYGLQPDDLVGYLLDPERGYAQVQAAYRGTRIGGAAASAGLRLSRARGEELGAMTAGTSLEELGGLTERYLERATEGAKLGSIYGIDYGEEEAAAETFTGAAGAATTRKKLTQRERAEFGGSAGVTQGSLSRGGGSY